MKRAAVIDIGSNSLKCLVAEPSPFNGIIPVTQKTLEVRISRDMGFNDGRPQFTDSAIHAGAEGVGELFDYCLSFNPDRVFIPATSAVREAENRDAFLEAIKTRTGTMPQVLSGDEEAYWIARGVMEDVAIRRELQDVFSLVDIGGGSLELVHVDSGTVSERKSLALGAVRASEMFLKTNDWVFDEATEVAIRQHTQAILRPLAKAYPPPLVGSGGAVTVTRNLLFQFQEQQHRVGTPFEEGGWDSSPVLSGANLRFLLHLFGGTNHEVRKVIPGVPVTRADILPTAVAILAETLECLGAEHLHHSYYNLRFGIAAGLLSGEI